MSGLSRRDFLAASALAATTPAWAQPSDARATDHPTPGANPEAPADARPPVVISSANGLPATQRAMALLQAGQPPLPAVVEGVARVEDDPQDHSVGYGGLPNEDGVVELDACVMDGLTHQCGGVAALRNIKNPSRVALKVMERTDHVLLVGEGALRFARAHGFEETNLLTDEARELWLRWRERRSEIDDWLPPAEVPDDDQLGQAGVAPAPSPLVFTHGTINCCAVDAAGNLAGVTTTSGLSFKIPGRVGDSPIIGAGLYVDNEVGAAGSTGRGEAVIRTGGARTVVEAMRHGASPREACLEALRYLVRKTTTRRLLRRDGRPNFNVKFYAVARDGRYGSASIWSGGQYAVCAGGQNRLEPCAYLYELPPDRHPA